MKANTHEHMDTLSDFPQIKRNRLLLTFAFAYVNVHMMHNSDSPFVISPNLFVIPSIRWARCCHNSHPALTVKHFGSISRLKLPFPNRMMCARSRSHARQAYWGCVMAISRIWTFAYEFICLLRRMLSRNVAHARRIPLCAPVICIC